MHSALIGSCGQPRSLRHPRDVPASCSYTARPQLSSRLLAKQRQRVVRVSAAAKSLYEVLGVSDSANERDIKRAYRQKALKLHPDVNKAPNAEAQFLEVKNAFTVLSDPQQRADYDRKLRWGSAGNWGGASGGGYGGWGSTAGSSSSTGSRPRPKQQEEEFYGLGDLLNEVGSGVGQWVQQQADELSKTAAGAAEVLGGVVQKAGDSIKSGKLEDFFNDLEKEVSAWSKKRAESGQPASLWEELSAIGEEFVDFLEQGLGEEAKGKDGTSRGGSAEFNHATSSSSSSRARTPMDKYEELKRRYDLYDESLKKKGAAGSATSSSSSGSGTGTGSSNGTGRAAAGRSGSSGGSATGAAGSSSSSSSSGARAGSSQPKTPQKTRDEEVEDELAALKRKLGKL